MNVRTEKSDELKITSLSRVNNVINHFITKIQQPIEKLLRFSLNYLNYLIVPQKLAPVISSGYLRP